MRHFFIIAVCLFFFPGCGGGAKVDPSFRAVTGTVTFNGSPVDGAKITFEPQDSSGLAATGVSDAQGKYVLTASTSLTGGTGTKPGKYRVVVSKFEAVIDQNKIDLDAGKITPEEYSKRQFASPPKPQKPKNLLPAIYADVKKTPLEVSVEDKRENILDLKIEGRD